MRHVRAEGNGWEKRFAQKFGVIYAAMVLGIAARLLPWPEHLPIKVVTRCYRKARNAARTEIEHVSYAAKKLSDILAKLGRMIVCPSRIRKGKFLRIPARCIAIRYTKGNRVTIGVFDDGLLKLLKTRKAKARFTAALAGAGVSAKAMATLELFKSICQSTEMARPSLNRTFGQSIEKGFPSSCGRPVGVSSRN